MANSVMAEKTNKDKQHIRRKIAFVRYAHSMQFSRHVIYKGVKSFFR